MIEYSFSEWLSAKQIQEAQLVAGAIGNPFADFQQKEGDFVYFGIHDLIKEYKQLGKMPQIDMGQIIQKVGRIQEANPIKRTLLVGCNVDPFQLGYRRLESKKTRDRRKMKGGSIVVEIKADHLENINYLMGTGEQLNAGNNQQSLWLAFDGSTQFQTGLIQEIRKEKTKRQIQEPVQDDKAKTDNVRNWLHGNDGTATVEPIKYTPATLWKDPPEAQKSQYQVHGRNVIDLSKQNDFVKQRLAALKQNRDVAHYDPSFMGFNRYWKTYNDARQYDYID